MTDPAFSHDAGDVGNVDFWCNQDFIFAPRVRISKKVYDFIRSIVKYRL